MKPRQLTIADVVDRGAGPHRTPAVPNRWLRQLALSIATNNDARTNTLIALISSLPQEGTTTIAVNLARVLEQEFQRRVVLVDTCLAAPALHLSYGLPRAPGLVEVLRADLLLREAVQISQSGSLAVLPAGDALPSEQGVLLANMRLPNVLDQLRREAFDVCLLDCPSVLAAPEAGIVARYADTTYCVVRAERTDWDCAEKATDFLNSAGCNLGGVVLNRVPLHIPVFLDRLL